MVERDILEDQCLEEINKQGIEYGFIFENIEFNEISLPQNIL